MVVATGPGQFYSSSLPRPRFFRGDPVTRRRPSPTRSSSARARRTGPCVALSWSATVCTATSRAPSTKGERERCQRPDEEIAAHLGGIALLGTFASQRRAVRVVAEAEIHQLAGCSGEGERAEDWRWRGPQRPRLLHRQQRSHRRRGKAARSTSTERRWVEPMDLSVLWLQIPRSPSSIWAQNGAHLDRFYGLVRWTEPTIRTTPIFMQDTRSRSS